MGAGQVPVDPLRRRRRRIGIALAVFAGLVFALLFLSPVVLRVFFDVRPFRVPSEAMAPTFQVGDRFLQVGTSSPERGDVVTYNPPGDGISCAVERRGDSVCPRPGDARAEVIFVHRVVGVGGDRLSVLDGRVYLNGRRQDEPWARPDDACQFCNLPREVTVPDDHYFVMGDNRGASSDSRVFGPLPSDWILGRAFLRYWPPGRIDGI